VLGLVCTRWEGGAPVSEAGIPATPLTSSELIVVDERPVQRTALGLLNPSPNPVMVLLFFVSVDPALPAGFAGLTLEGGEKRAFFLHEAFGNSLPPDITGLLRIQASAEIATLALLGVTNERGNFLMAALTGEPGREPLRAGASATAPRFATGGGYRTVLFLAPVSGEAAPPKGVIRFFDSNGSLLRLYFR
jgi:hypothetical protein